ncbi:MAG: hypothetical protein K2P14_10485 [Anaeroplasmataceae bacterium]|nr:hypothetical protein [Anaeroplasmataceae bacterium]
MAKKGIDISAHQGNIDLAVLKDQIDFVIIRAGYGTKGTIDTKFKRNADLCRQLGIPVGFYWYSYALNVDGAKKEATAMINAINPYKDIMKYGVWFDMEDADGYKKKNGMPSNEVLRQMCAEFCKMTEEAGFYSGIYASESWFNNQLKSTELDRFDKWVAQWPTSGGKQTALATNAEKRSDLHLWQFTSVGKFTGYNGNLDTNYAYVDFPNPGQVTVEPTPTPEPVKKSNEEIAEEVKAGKWGNGEDRKNKLTEAGYDYNAIQAIVNASYGASANMSITKGSKVKFTGTKSYSGINLASWTKNSIFDVIEVSGDRVVIGKGTAVTAAVNIKNCQKV